MLKLITVLHFLKYKVKTLEIWPKLKIPFTIHHSQQNSFLLNCQKKKKNGKEWNELRFLIFQMELVELFK